MKTILCVDDSRTIRQQVSFTLKKAGFNVLEAEDGAIGYRVLCENAETIAMVLSDVNMPNMNGLEMIEMICKDPMVSKIPCIMLTTEGNGELIARARAAGAKGWLVKPFKPEVLISACNKLTGG